ncbi:MAG: DUF559 domain-containing protein [Clostridia bacterium]|nr:DUF559 domain-containing protein [Clostridia bacterium]
MQHYKHNPVLTPLARSLRKDMTKEECHLLYDFLRTYPVRFLRQKVIDGYIVDFYCPKAKLIIELDGSQHYNEKGLKKDAERTKHLQSRGLAVIRVPNTEIHKRFRSVCVYIDWMVKKRLNRE